MKLFGFSFLHDKLIIVTRIMMTCCVVRLFLQITFKAAMSEAQVGLNKKVAFHLTSRRAFLLYCISMIFVFFFF